MTDTTTTALWPAIRALETWLDQANTDREPEQETALRLMKVSEEAGEACQAYINLQGQNPRKKDRVPASKDLVADELVDVVVTALVALCRFTDDPAAHLDTKLTAILARLDLA